MVDFVQQLLLAGWAFLTHSPFGDNFHNIAAMSINLHIIKFSHQLPQWEILKQLKLGNGSAKSSELKIFGLDKNA